MRPDQSLNVIAPRLYYVKRENVKYDEKNPMSPYQIYRYMYDRGNGYPTNFNEIAYRIEGRSLTADKELQRITDPRLRPQQGHVQPLPAAAVQEMFY